MPGATASRIEAGYPAYERSGSQPSSGLAPRAMLSPTCLCSSSRRSCRAIGARVAESPLGSPRRSVPAASTKRRVNSSAIASTTMKRLAAMQVCPALPKREATAPATALSRSASSRTTKASLPPSSITHFFSCWPALPATERPARSLPVSVTAATRGSRMTAAACSLSMCSTPNTPAGRPASSSTLAIRSAQRGTLLACLSTATFPAISAGARKRNTCQNGKFQGITASTQPSGS